MHKTFLRPLAVAALCGAVLAGCTPSGTTVSGKVVTPANLKLGPNDSLTILFHPEDPANTKSVLGVYAPADNTFVAKEIMPGKYKIQVQMQGYTNTPDAVQKHMEKLSSTYSREATPLKYEVVNDPKQSITIDLDKGTVTKS